MANLQENAPGQIGQLDLQLDPLLGNIQENAPANVGMEVEQTGKNVLNLLFFNNFQF